MITLFLMQLTRALDSESPDWKDNTIFLWDNAPYHTSVETNTVIKTLGIKIVFSGPYSYTAAPIELLFGGLKCGELNKNRLQTGKR